MALKVRADRRTGIYRITGTVAGKRIRKSAGTRDESLAKQIAAQLETRLWKGALYGAEAVVTFEDAAVAYMEDGGDGSFLAPLVAHFRGRVLRTIIPAEVRAAARKLYPGRKGSTLNRQAITPARAVINFAHRQGWCPPIRVEQFESKPPPRATVSPEWIAAFRAQALADRLPYLAALARFMYESACRVGEAVKVRPADCAPQVRTVMLYDTKNGEDYEVTLSVGLAAELAGLRTRRGRVFGYASRHSVYGPWENVCKRAGIAYVPPHQAGRHSFATTLDGDGWTAAQIAAAGRWKSVRMVSEVYTHPEGQSARAADVMGKKLASDDIENVTSLGAKRETGK